MLLSTEYYIHSSASNAASVIQKHKALICMDKVMQPQAPDDLEAEVDIWQKHYSGLS